MLNDLWSNVLNLIWIILIDFDVYDFMNYPICMKYIFGKNILIWDEFWLAAKLYFDILSMRGVCQYCATLLVGVMHWYFNTLAIWILYWCFDILPIEVMYWYFDTLLVRIIYLYFDTWLVRVMRWYFNILLRLYTGTLIPFHWGLHYCTWFNWFMIEFWILKRLNLYVLFDKIVYFKFDFELIYLVYLFLEYYYCLIYLAKVFIT